MPMPHRRAPRRPAVFAAVLTALAAGALPPLASFAAEQPESSPKPKPETPAKPAALNPAKSSGATGANASSAKAEEAKDPFAGLKVRLLGPAWGGRASMAVGVPGDPRVYYVATASGGVWKSNDGGQSFASVFDDQPTSSIGSIAVAPSDSNVLY